jgi:hypothetical protein
LGSRWAFRERSRDHPTSPARKPYIVVIPSDDRGYLDSCVYGATDVRTPNLKRLA